MSDEQTREWTVTEAAEAIDNFANLTVAEKAATLVHAARIDARMLEDRTRVAFNELCFRDDVIRPIRLLPRHIRSIRRYDGPIDARRFGAADKDQFNSVPNRWDSGRTVLEYDGREVVVLEEYSAVVSAVNAALHLTTHNRKVMFADGFLLCENFRYQPVYDR